jgi:ATP-dependent DNA ligase
MHLPVTPPILPMLAKRIDALPDGDGWIFEPKWDGFRALVFRDGDDLLLESRNAQPLARYFPELVDALKKGLPERCVLDGEIVIVTPHGLDFDLLQMRLHPAASRVKLLAGQTPASMAFFDLLAESDRDWREAPFAERRKALEKMLKKAKPPLHLSPATRDRAVAADWFARFEGAGFDGVMAKHESLTYQPDKRVMFKVKHEREADCVVAGFRWHKTGKGTLVGSLLLGLYDDAGDLQHVGVCASFTTAKRAELVEFLAPYRIDDLRGHPWKDWASLGEGDEAQRRPGAESRWSQGKDLSWVPLAPKLVVEVAYDHMQGNRFRHTAQFRRWRKDKRPAECTFEQLETVAPAELREMFGKGR